MKTRSNIGLAVALALVAGCSTSSSRTEGTEKGPTAKDDTRIVPAPVPAPNPGTVPGTRGSSGTDLPSTASTAPAGHSAPGNPKESTNTPGTIPTVAPSPVAVPKFNLTTPREPRHTVANGLKMLWVSLDGLRRDDVEKYLRLTKNPHPKGFSRLLGKGGAWSEVRVTNPSITSSSHVSTITCAPPGVHGILANGQWNGEAMESGFDKPYSTDNFVQALRRAGKRVGVLGYPSFDGRTPNRTADFGLAYDNSPIKSQYVALSETTPAVFSLASRQNIGAKFEASASWDAASSKARVRLPDGKEFELARGNWQQIEFVENDTTQLVSVRLFQNPADAAPTLYVAPTTSNNAYPTAFRKRMDAQHVVFSAGKNYDIAAKFGDSALLELMRDRLKFFGRAARTMLSEQKADAMFLYLEDLDVLGHQYAGLASAETLRADHFARLDQTLGSILELVPASANVLLVGDHGMSAINYELSANALIPADVQDKFVVKASGGSLFLYGKAKESVTQPAPKSEAWFAQTERALREMRLPSDPSKPLFAKVVARGSEDARKEGWRDSTALPWIAAFAQPGVGLRETVEKGLLLSVRKGVSLPPELLAQAKGGDASKLLDPVPLGQHGHASDSAEMLTNVVLLGPRFYRDAEKLGKRTTNLALVPFASDALGWPRPVECPRAGGSGSGK